MVHLLQKKNIDGIPFSGLTFGQNKENKYNSNTALKHLKDESSYFINDCKLTNPHIVIFSADNKLCLCGPLEPAQAP